MKALLLAAAVATLGQPVAAQDKPVLTIYTYDSFVAEWGPGPAIETAFEATCGCDLRLLAVGDGAGILARLKLEGARSQADVVLGLDTSLTAQARAEGLVKAHGLSPVFDLPVPWDDPDFVPYDWGYFAFVYDRTRVATPPASLAELAAGDLSIVIQDPRTSTPGLGLLMWVEAALGDGAASFWADLAGQVVTVTRGWDEAYGLFLEGEADLVLSYTTSPAYHILAEGDESKAAALFSDGHYMQIEVAGITATSDSVDLARDFLAFLTGPQAQAILPMTNWMYPVVAPSEPLPEPFALPDVRALLLSPDEAAARRDPALALWLEGLSR